jgi:acyl carrier protein
VSERNDIPGMNRKVALVRKSVEEIREELRGLPAGVFEAAWRYREDGKPESLFGMLPGMIAWHLPSGAAPPPGRLRDDLRLSVDLGLDSLALAEMAFKLDELLGVSIESGDVKGLATVGELKAFLARKLAEAAA